MTHTCTCMMLCTPDRRGCNSQHCCDNRAPTSRLFNTHTVTIQYCANMHVHVHVHLGCNMHVDVQVLVNIRIHSKHAFCTCKDIHCKYSDVHVHVLVTSW